MRGFSFSMRRKNKGMEAKEYIGKRFVRSSGFEVQAVEVVEYKEYDGLTSFKLALLPNKDKFIWETNIEGQMPWTDLWKPLTYCNLVECANSVGFYYANQFVLHLHDQAKTIDGSVPVSKKLNRVKETPIVAKPTGIQAQPEKKELLVTTYERIQTPVGGGAYSLNK